VTGQQPLHVARADSFQRLDKGRQVAAMMRVDRAHAAVPVHVVAAEQQLAQAKAKLAVGVSRRLPHLQFQTADPHAVALVDFAFDFDRRQGHVDALRRDFGETEQPIAAAERTGRQRMCRRGGPQHLFSFGQALDVIDVGVRGDDRPALRQRKIHVADQFHDLLDRVVVADVDQQPLVGVVNQVHVGPDHMAGLVVHLDDVRKNRLALQHGFSSRGLLFADPTAAEKWSVSDAVTICSMAL